MLILTFRITLKYLLVHPEYPVPLGRGVKQSGRLFYGQIYKFGGAETSARKTPDSASVIPRGVRKSGRLSQEVACSYWCEANRKSDNLNSFCRKSPGIARRMFYFRLQLF